MGSINRPLIPEKYRSTAGWSSLLVPGLGQLLLGYTWRGVLILLTTPILAFIAYWAIDRNIGSTLGEANIPWLWLPVILFWLWNVLDARQLAARRKTSAGWGLLLAAVILYVVAWNVTNVRLDRLIANINRAGLVTGDILNADLITINKNGVDEICAWQCLSTYLGDVVAGRTPQGTLRMSDNLKDILGQVKEQAAPRWQVHWGLAPEGSRFDQFVPGGLIETVAMGLLATLFSTILAVPLSFLAAHNVMGRIPVIGSVIYYLTRTFLNAMRAIDTAVWGLIVVVWIGQGSFAGMIALTIHSMAALAKLFSEEIEHIDPGPVEAVTASGANMLQVIRYAILPQIVPPFLAYTLLRWDINMRSATVVGFVGGGGIGFFVVETIRMGGYQQYGAALWTVAVVIILVDYLSARWRENILKDKPSEVGKPKRPVLTNLKRAAYIILGLALFFYCALVTKVDLNLLFDPGPTFGRLISDFVSVDLSADVLDKVIEQMLITIFQALLATTLGALIALPFSFLAARNLTGQNKITRILLYYPVRTAFNVLRSIEALLYVAIFNFWVGIGPFPGMLALAVTTFALIGKLFSEAIENIDPGPIEAVSATGANIFQVIRYAIMPQIFPPFMSYLIYQWDINVRMATIIGFAGGGGIGLIFQTYFNMLQYHKAGTVVLFIVVVVALMDFASAKLREKLV